MINLLLRSGGGLSEPFKIAAKRRNLTAKTPRLLPNMRFSSLTPLSRRSAHIQTRNPDVRPAGSSCLWPHLDSSGKRFATGSSLLVAASRLAPIVTYACMYCARNVPLRLQDGCATHSARPQIGNRHIGFAKGINARMRRDHRLASNREEFKSVLTRKVCDGHDASFLP